MIGSTKENRRRAEQEAREKRLIATVRERLRFYESTDGYIPRAGRQTLDALKKLEARVQVEVTYDQYRDLCGQTWGDIRVFVESEKGEKVKEFSDALTKAIEQYNGLPGFKWVRATGRARRNENKSLLRSCRSYESPVPCTSPIGSWHSCFRWWRS